MDFHTYPALVRIFFHSFVIEVRRVQLGFEVNRYLYQPPGICSLQIPVFFNTPSQSFP